MSSSRSPGDICATIPSRRRGGSTWEANGAEVGRPDDPGHSTCPRQHPRRLTLRPAPIRDPEMLSNSPFFQLYRARLREFWRQPARIFWVYGFPTVLAVILGLAFQNRPPAPSQADLVESPYSSVIEQAIKA